jgi:hypothetical protein
MNPRKSLYHYQLEILRHGLGTLLLFSNLGTRFTVHETARSMEMSCVNG